MQRKIANIDAHPALITWMRERFGTTCSSAEILATISSAYVRYPSLVDLAAEHMSLVSKIAGIAERTGCPQRVPTFREYESLAANWSVPFDGPSLERGSEIISPEIVKTIENDIVARAWVTKTVKMDAFRAAA